MKDNTVTIILGSLADGNTLTCVVTGSISDVGVADNTIASCTIADANGNDVTRCYDITKIIGVLQILEGSVV